MFVSLQFSKNFLLIKQYSRVLYNSVNLLMIIIILGAAIVYFTNATNFIFPFLTIRLVIWQTAASVVTLKKGYKPARYYLLAISIVLVIAFFGNFQYLQVIPYSYWMLKVKGELEQGFRLISLLLFLKKRSYLLL